MPFAALLIPFFVTVAVVVLIGLSQTSAHTSTHAPGFSGFLDTIVHNNILTQIWHVTGNATRRMLSKFAASHLPMVTAYLHTLARLLRMEQRAMRANAHASARVAAELDRAIPIEARKAAAPAHRLAKHADRRAGRALSQEHVTARELHRFRTDTRARLKADAHAIDVTIPHDIGALRRRARTVEDAQAKDRDAIGELEHGAARTWDWIRRHPLGIAAAGFAGAVAVALNRLGLGWLRCRSNPFTKSKNPCGLWNDLAGLLGLATAAVAVYEFDTLMRETQALADDAIKIIDDVFGVGS